MERAFPKFGYNPVTGEWNDSLRGDYFWSSVNVSEAVPDVITPSTWSLLWIYFFEIHRVDFPGDHPICGNICGRPYVNLSMTSSLYHAVGMLTEKFGDLKLIKVGLLGGALGFVFVAFAWNYLTTLLALGFFILALALIGPALNSYISNFAGEHQGTVMGLNSAFTSLGKVVGPLWGGYIYDINLEYPFFSGAATLLIGLLVSVIGLQKQVTVNLTHEHERKIHT